MAMIYQFRRGHDVIRVAHDGASLITGEGDNAAVQTFDDATDARNHLEYVASRLRRNGYAMSTAVEDMSAGSIERAELGDHAKWDPEHARLTVTFRSAALAPGLCPKLAGAAEGLRPISMHVQCDPGSPGVAFAEALLHRPLPSLQRFVFDTNFQTLARQRGNAIGDLTDVLSGLPNLESAFVSGEVLMRPAQHLKLRGLWLLGDPLLPSTVSAVGHSRFPALERLGLALRHETPSGADAAAVRALLRLDAPHLTIVEVEGVDDVAAFLAGLTEKPLPASWRHLWVNGIVEEDALLAVLEQRAALLQGLESLVLPLGDELSSDGEARARALVPGLVDCEELDDPFLPSTYEAW
jgi:hypothetical protein